MRGRRTTGSALVASLEAPRGARERLRVLLATITGEISLAGAAARVGLGRTRVLALRRHALQAAVDALAPRPLGRPAHAPRADVATTRHLEARIRELELALQAALVRTEVALTMPFLLRRGGGKKDAHRPSPARPARARRARRRATGRR